jgi:DNA-binding PadR family transcriptional regulator
MFLVLLTLNHGPKHGYGIKKEVAERSGGAVDLDAGGLYRLVARLEEQGWVEATDAPPAGEEEADARRKYYALTEDGKTALAAEARRMAGLIQAPDVRDLLAGEAPA